MKPAPAGKRYDVMDAIVPGLGVRVTDKGKRTFVLLARFPGSTNPTRRSLGIYGAMTLETARERAREWHQLISRGIDPKDLEGERRAAEQHRRENTFGAVADDYIRLAVIGPDPSKPLQRKGPQVARELQMEFIDDRIVDGKKRLGLGKRPIDSVTRHDIVRIIDDTVARGAKYQAHNLLGNVRAMFNWAIARGVYGIETSPCDRMPPRQVIGKKALRTRVLNDDELAALWKAAEQLGYPYGPLFQLLALTGQRKSEVAEARWSEFNLERRLWAIPPERMKADAPHVVPLSDDALAILRDLPRFKGKDFIFSTTFGEKPVNGFSKSKARLDAKMIDELREVAAKRGGEAETVELHPFVIHDIRRTVRTGLSALPVSSDVAELVIAHARPGLRRVYDQFGYLDEKRRALDLWAQHVRSLVAPQLSNVVALQARVASDV